MVRARAVPSAGHDASAAEPSAAEADADAAATGVLYVPPAPTAAAAIAAAADDLPPLRVWEAPDRREGGEFPLWLGADGRADRVVVLVEGFDLYNRYSATDALRLIGPAGDALRAAGVDVLVVDFPDSHLAPDALAPRVARAVRAASAAAGGRDVAVACLSAGGLAARWALVAAEEAGAPLPARTVVFLDTPHRGARVNPALQALVLRYGKRADRDALSSEAARALLAEAITDPAAQVTWLRVGVPPAHRLVPAECRPTAERHDAFFGRLRGLNDRGGYPKRCRLVAVANSSRGAGGPGPAAAESSRDCLLRMWLPWGCGWTLPAAAADRAAGSVMPRVYAEQFRVNYPLGLAGAYLRGAPTFLPNASALDAGPGEAPPFDAWYARPDGLQPLAHDRVDPGAAAFAVRELLRPGTWEKPAPAVAADETAPFPPARRRQ